MFNYSTQQTTKRTWKIQGYPDEFDSLMEMKDALWLHQKDTVFDYARRNNLKIYCNENDKGHILVYNAKTLAGVQNKITLELIHTALRTQELILTDIEIQRVKQLCKFFNIKEPKMKRVVYLVKQIL